MNLQRVWVTRDEPADGSLTTALRGRGLRPVWQPVLRRQLRPDALEALRSIQPGDWLVLTSPFAIDSVAALSEVRGARLAVVGEASRQRAAELGLHAELMGSEPDAESLFTALGDRVGSGRVLYAHSAASPARAREFRDNWIDCVLYDTIALAYDRAILDRVDIVTVASPSAVRALGTIARPFASIGRTTTAAALALGNSVAVEAARPTFAALADAIAAASQPSRDQRA